MKAYTTARFAYSRNKWKNSFAKVKNKNCQETTITTRITFVCVSVQCHKCSKVGIIKGHYREVVQRLSEEVLDNIVWYTRFYLLKNIIKTD